MVGRVAQARTPLITDARLGASLSTDQRMRRYVLTMGFRVVAFLAAVVSPTPWNVALFLAAALLPAIAVLLGNARDNRPAPAVGPEGDTGPRELTTGDVVAGRVQEPNEQENQ